MTKVNACDLPKFMYLGPCGFSHCMKNSVDVVWIGAATEVQSELFRPGHSIIC